MRKAAIVIDKWKLPIFERHLRQAGYVWEQTGGLTDDLLQLFITTKDVVALGFVVRAANAEAANKGSTIQ